MGKVLTFDVYQNYELTDTLTVISPEFVFENPNDFNDKCFVFKDKDDIYCVVWKLSEINEED